jgi:lipoyl(octanoyl) transferase
MATHLFLLPPMPYLEYQKLQAFCLQWLIASPEKLDVVFLTAHPPCYTIGKAMHLEDDITRYLWHVYACERGGQLTFHHPQQVICYPLLHLKNRNVHAALARILGWGSMVATRCGLTVLSGQPETGVWVQALERPNGRGKIASLGLAVKRWVTYHGLAFNVNVPPVMWNSLPAGVHPCGLPDDKPYNLSDAAPHIAREQVEHFFIEALEEDVRVNSTEHSFSVTALDAFVNAEEAWQSIKLLLE